MTRTVVLGALAAALAPWAVAELALALSSARGRSQALARALARIGRRLGAPEPPGDLAARLAAAGLADRLRVADAMAIKVGAAVVGVLLAAVAATVLPDDFGRLALLAGPLAAFLAPDLWLRRRVRARRRRLEAELPDALELLRVAVEAGLAPMRALEEVGRHHRGLVGAELQVTAARVALGVPRAQALDALEARCPLAAISTLVTALWRADRHGAPLAAALAALALDARAERGRAVRDRAARAAPRIQLVIALVLVPAVLALVGAALVSAFAL